MGNVTDGAISLFTNLIGTPTYYEILADGKVFRIIDLEYITKSVVLVVFVVTLCGILIKFAKIGGKR